MESILSVHILKINPQFIKAGSRNSSGEKLTVDEKFSTTRVISIFPFTFEGVDIFVKASKTSDEKMASVKKKSHDRIACQSYLSLCPFTFEVQLFWVKTIFKKKKA